MRSRKKTFHEVCAAHLAPSSKDIAVTIHSEGLAGMIGRSGTPAMARRIAMRLCDMDVQLELVKFLVQGRR